MSGLDELLRSPMDDEPSSGGGNRVVRVASGTLAAVVVFSALLIGVGRGGPTTDGATTTTSVTTTTASAGSAGDAFPSGYIPVTDEVAMRALSPQADGTTTLVPVEMVVRRGVESDVAPRPLGGIFEAAGGASTGVVTDPLRPGTLSVVFPGSIAGVPELQMRELWAPVVVERTSSQPFTGAPYRAPEPLVFELGDGITLTIDELWLENYRGAAVWFADGSDLVTARIVVEMIAADGTPIGQYVARPSTLTPSDRGHVLYFWSPTARITGEGATTYTVTVTATVGRRVPVDITIPIGSE